MCILDTLGIASLFMQNDIFDDAEYEILLVVGLPALFSIIYTNAIADDKVGSNYYYSKNYNSLRSSYGNNKIMLPHKDLYNSKKIFEIDIFRIRF